MNIFKKQYESTASFMRTYYRAWVMKSRKNSRVWRKRMCRFIKTMHQFTHPLSRLPKLMSWSSNCFLIHPIGQIQPLWIIFSFQTWKNDSVFKDFPTMRKWSLRLMDISWNSTILTINWLSKLLNIDGRSVSSSKETT